VMVKRIVIRRNEVDTGVGPREPSRHQPNTAHIVSALVGSFIKAE
jgi:hypothetical protein